MMNVRVKPENVWSFYIENRRTLAQKMLLLAANDDLEASVYITDEDGLPQFYVFCGDDPIFQLEGHSAAECEETAKNLYEDYLSDDQEALAVAEDSGKSKEEDTISKREDELDDAFGNLLEAISTADYYRRPDADNVCDDIKELVCEYLYRKYGISVYRPMYLEDEDGKDFYAEYPYEHMVFDDPDNPLYK